MHARAKRAWCSRPKPILSKFEIHFERSGPLCPCHCLLSGWNHLKSGIPMLESIFFVHSQGCVTGSAGFMNILAACLFWIPRMLQPAGHFFGPGKSTPFFYSMNLNHFFCHSQSQTKPVPMSNFGLGWRVGCPSHFHLKDAPKGCPATAGLLQIHAVSFPLPWLPCGFGFKTLLVTLW